MTVDLRRDLEALTQVEEALPTLKFKSRADKITNLGLSTIEMRMRSCNLHSKLISEQIEKNELVWRETKGAGHQS